MPIKQVLRERIKLVKNMLFAVILTKEIVAITNHFTVTSLFPRVTIFDFLSFIPTTHKPFL